MTLFLSLSLYIYIYIYIYWCLHGLTGSVVAYRSIALGFKAWLGYVRRAFHLSLCSIILWDWSNHLAYHVPKSGCKMATYIYIYIYASIYYTIIINILSMLLWSDIAQNCLHITSHRLDMYCYSVTLFPSSHTLCNIINPRCYVQCFLCHLSGSDIMSAFHSILTC